MENKNSGLVKFLIVIIVLLVLSLVGVVLINKGIITINSNNKVEEKKVEEKKEHIEVGSLGDKLTTINTGNEIRNPFLYMNVELDGRVIAKNEETKNEYIINGIDEKVISIAKTVPYQDSNDFEVAVLTENGNIYAINFISLLSIGENGTEMYYGDLKELNFKKIETNIKFYGLGTKVSMSPATYLVGYDKDNMSHSIEFNITEGKWEVE